MELFILLSLLTAFASSASLNLCDEGESFWCQSLANAKACGAVHHCKATVWKNMNLEECKELIGEEGRHQVGDSELALRMMCCSLGICNRDAILEYGENLPLEMKQREWSLSESSASEKCRACQKFFSSLKARLQDSDTQTFIRDILHVEFCPLATAVNNDMCKRAVGSTLPLIVKLSLQFYDHKTICQQLTMCALAEDDLDQSDIDWNMLHPRITGEKGKETNCTECYKVIEYITKKENISGLIEATVVNNFCRYVDPIQYRMMCMGFAKFLAPRIASKLDRWLDMQKFDICSYLRLCHHPNGSQSLQHQQQQQQQQHQHQQHQQLLASRKPDEETIVCQLCLQVLKTVIESETVDKTEGHKTICQQFTMCALAEDDLDQSDVDWSSFLLFIDNNLNKSLKCEGCKGAIDMIAKQNFSGVIETTILTYFCQGNPLQMLCKGIVMKLLVPQITENLKTYLDFLNPCHIYQCNDSKNTFLSMQQQHHQQQQQLLATREPDKETTVCQLCLQVIKTTIEISENKTTLLKAMQKVCDSISSSYRRHCHGLVDAFGRPTLQMLSHRLHPEAACAMLGFCDGASDIDVIRDIVETVSSERCSFCQSTSEYLAVFLGQERASNEIQSQMKRICEFRPFGLDEEECESVVDKHIPMLVSYLIDDLSQDNNVCQRTSLCTGLTSDIRDSQPTIATLPPTILELWPQFRCLYGAQFWCATMENAKLCQMEQYCGEDSK